LKSVNKFILASAKISLEKKELQISICPLLPAELLRGQVPVPEKTERKRWK